MTPAAAHRNDIDGLRAVAVLPVMLFHAGVPGFGGGYVGVDVFFVISGYLITGIIHRELEQGRFTIAKFYERRVRRIFPALFVLLAAVFVAGYATLVPPDFAQLGKSIVATALFSSNIFFYRQSGYFDTTADTKPLLHTWSLAVEEQYYILFPLAVLAIYRWRRDWLVPAVVAAMLASFLLSALTVGKDPVAAFFLPHSRAWELLLGSALSFVATRRIEALAWAGLLLIGAAVFGYDQATPFPGPSALLPCLGAGAILVAADGTRAGRLLSNPALTFVGKISYSLYLWHWAIIVFTLFAFGGEHWLVRGGLCLIASFVLATLSWRYVEMPFRRRGRSPRKPLLAGAAALVLGVSIGAAAMTGIPGRLPPRAAALAAVSTEERPVSPGCFYPDGPNPASIAQECFAQGPYRTILWGDSHALQYAAPLNGLLGGRVGTVGRGGCAPLDLTPVRTGRQPDEACRTFNAQILRAIVASPSIETVILSARWARFTFPSTDDEAQGFTGVADDERLDQLISSLRRTILELQRAGKKIVLIGPEPEFRDRLPTCLARALWLGRSEAICAHRELTLPGSPVDLRLRRLQASVGDVAYFRPADAICPGGQCIRTFHGRPVSRDSDHFTNEVAAFVVGRLIAGEAGVALRHSSDLRASQSPNREAGSSPRAPSPAR